MKTSLTQNGCCGGTSCDDQSQKVSSSTSANVNTTTSRTTTVRPRVNIFENETAFLVDVEMPGVDENNAEIVLEKNLLSVKGSTPPVTREGYQHVFGNPHQYSYERSFQVPEGIDRDGLTASMKNGVLSITLPKAAKLQPQKVSIKAG